MNRKTIAAIVLATAFAGCTPKEEQLAAADHATCVEYGVPQGHPEYASCRMLVRQMRTQEQTARAMGGAAAYSVWRSTFPQ